MDTDIIIPGLYREDFKTLLQRSNYNDLMLYSFTITTQSFIRPKFTDDQITRLLCSAEQSRLTDIIESQLDDDIPNFNTRIDTMNQPLNYQGVQIDPNALMNELRSIQSSTFNGYRSQVGSNEVRLYPFLINGQMNVIKAVKAHTGIPGNPICRGAGCKFCTLPHPEYSAVRTKVIGSCLDVRQQNNNLLPWESIPLTIAQYVAKKLSEDPAAVIDLQNGRNLRFEKNQVNTRFKYKYANPEFSWNTSPAPQLPLLDLTGMCSPLSENDEAVMYQQLLAGGPPKQHQSAQQPNGSQQQAWGQPQQQQTPPQTPAWGNNTWGSPLTAPQQTPQPMQSAPAQWQNSPQQQPAYIPPQNALYTPPQAPMTPEQIAEMVKRQLQGK